MYSRFLAIICSCLTFHNDVWDINCSSLGLNAQESDCSSQSKSENINVAPANLIVDPTKNTYLTNLFDLKTIWYCWAIIWDDILDYYRRGPVWLALSLGDCTYQEQFIFMVEFFWSFTWNLTVKGPYQGKLCVCMTGVLYMSVLCRSLVEVGITLCV